MGAVIEISEWLCLNDGQREEVSNGWDVYAGEGLAYATIAAGCLLVDLEKQGVRAHRTECGVYHGGEWAITVYLESGLREVVPYMPDSYQGFKIVVSLVD